MARHLDAFGMGVVLEDAAFVAGRSAGAAEVCTLRDVDVVSWKRPLELLREMAETSAGRYAG